MATRFYLTAYGMLASLVVPVARRSPAMFPPARAARCALALQRRTDLEDEDHRHHGCGCHAPGDGASGLRLALAAHECRQRRRAERTVHGSRRGPTRFLPIVQVATAPGPRSRPRTASAPVRHGSRCARRLLRVPRLAVRASEFKAPSRPLRSHAVTWCGGLTSLWRHGVRARRLQAALVLSATATWCAGCQQPSWPR